MMRVFCRAVMPVLAFALVTLAGCSHTGTTAKPSASGSAATSSLPSSASPAQSGTAAPSGAGATGGPGQAGCASGRVQVTWAPEQHSVDSLCVQVGAEVVVALRPPPGHQWTPLVSSDTAVAAVGPTGRDQEGAAHATVTAVRPGTAVISSAARAFEGAPGPLAVPWRLTVSVRG